MESWHYPAVYTFDLLIPVGANSITSCSTTKKPKDGLGEFIESLSIKSLLPKKKKKKKKE
jgi:hypothetical protein